MKMNVVERVFKYELTYFSNLCPVYRYSAIVGEEHDVVYSGIAIVIQNVWNISCNSWRDTRSSLFTYSNLLAIASIIKIALPTILEATHSDIRSPLEMLIPDPM
jgi:hypothetical protein